MLHEIVAVVFPLTGVTSGSGEVNVMVDGTAMTVPVMANASGFTTLSNAAAAAGRLDVRSAAGQIVEHSNSTQIVSIGAIRALDSTLGCGDGERRGRGVRAGLVYRIVGESPVHGTRVAGLSGACTRPKGRHVGCCRGARRYGPGAGRAWRSHCAGICQRITRAGGR
jgi:hypothetical protein